MRPRGSWARRHIAAYPPTVRAEPVEGRVTTPAPHVDGRLAELHHELVGLAPDRRIEDVLRVIVRGIGEHTARPDIAEARRFDLLAHHRGIDAVPRRGARQACAGRIGMVDDDIGAALFQQLEHRRVECAQRGFAGAIVWNVVIILHRPEQVDGLRHGRQASTAAAWRRASSPDWSARAGSASARPIALPAGAAFSCATTAVVIARPAIIDTISRIFCTPQPVGRA
ncbi:hypothetical protein WR25_15073 [Diploscapter pachys]|uniref:Uncharacterized protein n=1 Tax=Diploscapter pachys TaxID=2018661 RepID=A0A2A2JX47_9BILA|nr:hypothetical protein WR25_15073 [Diploscapter pachys]